MPPNPKFAEKVWPGAASALLVVVFTTVDCVDSGMGAKTAAASGGTATAAAGGTATAAAGRTATVASGTTAAASTAGILSSQTIFWARHVNRIT